MTESKHSSDNKKDRQGSIDADAVDQYWAQKYRTRSGVDWSTLLTDEDKFALRILNNEGASYFNIYSCFILQYLVLFYFISSCLVLSYHFIFLTTRLYN